MKKDQTQLPQSQQVRNKWRTIPPDEMSCFCLPTDYFPKHCRQGGTNNPKTVLLTALITYYMTNLFLCRKCYISIPPPLLWSSGCQNETTGWEITLSRFVRPCCSSFPSYFSRFLSTSAVAHRRWGEGHLRTGKYCLKKHSWKQVKPCC